MNHPSITVAVPAYNRTRELEELLQSFLEASVLPDELLVSEDQSAERPQIRDLVAQYVPRLAERGCSLRLIENATNLGYDGNVRSAIENSASDWVMLLGNDDVIAKNGIEFAQEFISSHPDVQMVSRTFYRFVDDWHSPIGVSRAHSQDGVFSQLNASPAVAFRLCGFVGGLIVNRAWATSLATTAYDGTLYYQLYLAFHAYCESGIGYISRVVVGGRTGNIPLFGTAAAEKALHLPGSYRPKARAHMWASVLRIANDIGQLKRTSLQDAVRHELDSRQSFHVFEMMATSPRSTLLELRDELRRVGLQRSLQARLFFSINYALGKHARHFYTAARRLLQ